MTAFFVDSTMDDQRRRSRVFEGDLFLFRANAASKELVDFARQIIRESFQEVDPQQAQSDMKVEDFVATIAPLKTRFTNHERTKALVQNLLTEFGCDKDRTYF